MARYDVTPELAALIKSTRLAKKVTAKSIVEHIDKSQAYFTKLERGEIKSIDQDELIDIFMFILGSEDAFQEFLNTTLAETLTTISLRYSDDEIKKEIWFRNFDEVQRLIPIPKKLVEELVDDMKNNNISIEYLCERINGNECISSDIKDIDTYSYNFWHSIVENGEFKDTFIKMKLEAEEIGNILSQKNKSSNYVTVLSIAYYIRIIKLNKGPNNITKDEYKILFRETKQYLNEHRFFSLQQKHYLESTAKSDAERESLMSVFDKENAKTINNVIEMFRLFSDFDMLKATEYLNKFEINLKWDCAFIFRLISFEFDKITCDVSEKQKLLNEINDLVHKYINIKPEDNPIQLYD